MIPYSETDSPRRTAASRSATLWSFEPVKCWSRFPYDSGGTTRRSKRRPSCETTVAFVGPRAATSTTHGSEQNASMSAAGSVAVAMMSRSRTVSRKRRAEPAIETSTAAGWAASVATAARSFGSVRPSRARRSAGSASAFAPSDCSPARIFSSDFAPEPGQPAELLRLGGGPQVGDGRDPELLPDPPGGLRAEPGQVHERRHLRGHDRLPLRERVHLAVVDDLDDLLLDRPADPLQLLRAPLERELRDRARRLADLRGGPAVRRDPEPVLALDLHQVGEEVELRRQVGVARQSVGGAADTSR